MREENKKRLENYVNKNAKPFGGITKAVKEIENMKKAKVSGKRFHEINEKRGFYPHDPAIKSVQRKSKAIQKTLDKNRK